MIGLVVGASALLLILSGLRVWIIYRGFHGLWPGAATASVLTQLSGLCGMAAVLFGEPALLFLIGVPELALPAILALSWTWRAFLVEVLVLAAPLAALVSCVALWRPLRRYSVSIFGLALAASCLAIGNWKSTQQMCQAALAMGAQEITRNSLSWSLANAPREFQFGMHAELQHDGARFGWSYRDRSWYEVPNTVQAEVGHDRVTRCVG